ncbi:nitroreductase family protein [Roseateles albus]|uniref:Nitroreductase family protein n=1 Tax=Roseateles albus TaxID=2987525 RepID=A0ABT5KGH6_9BURK|nr:nitroreductase family protein [Roseateles albus]MDC8773028.1 nitroreductase family protein [Roseateles albus]
MTDINHLIRRRISGNHFDPKQTLQDEVLTQLVDLATRAPSAFHLQNWKFIAVRSAPAKARLKALAYGQNKVEDASVCFIICGTLQAHRQLGHSLQAAVDAGIVPVTLRDTWVNMAQEAMQGQTQAQRDEAIRSASLAAMTLMLAAEGLGLMSCPMSGFDAPGVTQAFGLSANELPVLLLPVGHAAPGNWPQKPRKPLSEVLAFA